MVGEKLDKIKKVVLVTVLIGEIVSVVLSVIQIWRKIKNRKNSEV